MPQPDPPCNNDSDIILMYVTMPTLKEAEQLGRALVKEKLAACINILPGMLSIYEWQGNTQTAAEAVMIIKTTKARATLLRDYISTHHPYETPCMLAIPVDEECSGRDYLQWLTQSLVND